MKVKEIKAIGRTLQRVLKATGLSSATCRPGFAGFGWYAGSVFLSGVFPLPTTVCPSEPSIATLRPREAA